MVAYGEDVPNLENDDQRHTEIVDELDILRCTLHWIGSFNI